MRLAAGYEDGAVKIWDLKTGQPLHTISPNIHQIRVTDLDTHHENNLLASISTDGKEETGLNLMGNNLRTV